MTCAQRTKTRTSISRKICCLKSGFQILYAVEQFSSLFSKDKLKQGAHIHQTHDPPSLRMSWENCPVVPSQQLPHSCVVWSWHLKDSPRQERVFIHGFCHCTPALLSIVMSFGHCTDHCTTGSVAGGA